jgi:outer membrane protein insertion porin family
MKKILLFLIFLIVGNELLGQFRNSRSQSQPANEPTLNYAAPQTYIIAGIEVSGLNVLDKTAMLSLTGLRIGDEIKIPGDGISGAIRKLWKHGLVGDVVISVQKIEGTNVYLSIELTERPRLNDFYFVGISKGSQTSLKDDMKLIKGKIVNDATIRNAELSVKKHFVKKGFLNTVVKVIPEADSLNRGGVRLRIDVDLKSKVKINAVLIDGNSAVADAKLKAKLKKTHERPRISIHRTLIQELLMFKPSKIKPALDSSRNVTGLDVKEFINRNIKLNVFAGSKFIRSDFEEDKLKLIDYYNSLGYRDAEVLSDTIYAFDKTNVDVNLNVYEGRKYYFRNITWVGNYIHSANILNKILDISKGDVYNNELILKKTTFNPKGADISGLYMDDGYLFFRVTPVEVAVVGDSIDVEMRIFEGDQATIDEVTFSGNERTNDHVIRRELSTIPGQKFRRSDLIRTQQQLSQMGYFNPQKIDQDVRPNITDGTVDIEWKLEEQSSDQIELSGGWGGYYGFVGTVGLTFNNFSVRNVPHLDKWKPLPTETDKDYHYAFRPTDALSKVIVFLLLSPG